MNIEWIDTKAIYHQLIQTSDESERERLYLERLAAPWSQMMAMASQGDNPLEGARAWHWVLPDELTRKPPALVTLEEGNAWERGERAMRKAAQRFVPYADRIPFDTFTGWLVIANPETSEPIMRGCTGSIDWMQPRFVVQYDTPTPRNLRSLEGMIIHEMNHLVRLRVFPWSMSVSVGDYIIHEGVAESFAAALYGEEVLGHYVTEFDDSQLATAKRIIGAGLDETGFDVIRSYIFGDHWARKLGLPQFGVPNYGGYAIGYWVVQAYLKQTGRSIEETTFTSAQEIIEASGFFDE